MTAQQDILELIQLFLPKYLTPGQKTELWAELASFPENRSFYLNHADLREQLLQGDGWRGFVAIDFSTGFRKTVSGVILSNTCDISQDNQRDFPVNILFAPLIELGKYENRLRAIAKTDEQIASILSVIRRQRITSIFYLPECPGNIAESIIMLDNIYAHPLQDFLSLDRQSLFTLNQYAFYLFLMKLSIHFSRFQEGIARFHNIN